MHSPVENLKGWCHLRHLGVDKKNAVKFHFTRRGSKRVDEVAKDRIHWPTLVNTEIILRVLSNAGDSLTITTISFSRSVLHSKKLPELCLKIQFVPHSKHTPLRLWKWSANALWANYPFLCSEIHSKKANSNCWQKEFLMLTFVIRNYSCSIRVHTTELIWYFGVLVAFKILGSIQNTN